MYLTILTCLLTLPTCKQGLRMTSEPGLPFPCLLKEHSTLAGDNRFSRATGYTYLASWPLHRYLVIIITPNTQLPPRSHGLPGHIPKGHAAVDGQYYYAETIWRQGESLVCLTHRSAVDRASAGSLRGRHLIPRHRP